MSLKTSYPLKEPNKREDISQKLGFMMSKEIAFFVPFKITASRLTEFVRGALCPKDATPGGMASAVCTWFRSSSSRVNCMNKKSFYFKKYFNQLVVTRASYTFCFCQQTLKPCHLCGITELITTKQAFYFYFFLLPCLRFLCNLSFIKPLRKHLLACRPTNPFVIGTSD